MKQFLVFDFNGWLDHYWIDRKNDESGETRALGFRSCLYKHNGRWLVGAQALAAARFENALSGMVDASDALAAAAGLGQLSLKSEEHSPLPSALWNLVEAANNTSAPNHLALIVPDNQDFGSLDVRQGGKTRLEDLYGSLHAARPASLATSRIELVWRSVAVLQAALNKNELRNEVGEVLIVSVNEQILWRVLKLSYWSRNNSDDERIHIVRGPSGASENNRKKGEIPWIKNLRSIVEKRNSDDIDQLCQWTRWIEILASNVPATTLGQFGIDSNAIEHKTWPMGDEEYALWHEDTPADVLENYDINVLQEKLKQIVARFLDRQTDKPIAVIIENPISEELVAGMRFFHKHSGEDVPVYYVSGTDTLQAATHLAKVLAESNHHEGPAWLDSVPEIQLEVRGNLDDDQVGSTNWIKVVSENEVVPAGEIYSTPKDRHRRINLAPGIEYVHLHLCRGNKDLWDERYTQHAIDPSDHVRVVEPLAKIRPLSEVARIEIVEHLPNGDVETLAGPTNGIKWDDLTSEKPPILGSIPELYIFEASEEGWKDIKPILKRIVASGQSGDGPSQRISLRDELYKCTQNQWRIGQFPLGSDGLPPRTSGGQNYDDDQELLRRAIAIIVRDLEHSVENRIQFKNYGVANRLHLGLTWLFTGCPDKVTNILLEAIINPVGNSGVTLCIDKQYAAWSIYSGVGRTAKRNEFLNVIYDELLVRWEEDSGGTKQDKFLLAAVSHPLARRYLVRSLFYEDQKRFERVKRFLWRHLENIVRGIHDPRPRKKQPSLELRYVIMGYRGLCQIRYKHPEWFPHDGIGEGEAENVYHTLMQLSKTFRFSTGGIDERKLLELSAPYLIGEGRDPTMPGGF